MMVTGRGAPNRVQTVYWYITGLLTPVASIQHARHCAPPTTAIFIYREQSGESGTVHFPWLTSCMKSATHRTQTDAVINNNFYAPSEDVFMFCFVRTMECAISLTVVGALEMQLLLLLLLLKNLNKKNKIRTFEF